VEGLYIRYREVSEKPEYQMVTVLNAGATSYVLTNLKKFMRYEFFLVPFYKTIEGRPSNVKLVTTLEDVPSGAPVNVHVGMINMTSAFVRWSPPPKNTQNGQLIGYKVSIIVNLPLISRKAHLTVASRFVSDSDPDQDQQQQQDPGSNVPERVHHVGDHQ
jgi:roundabout axon guidance receptor 2